MAIDPGSRPSDHGHREQLDTGAPGPRAPFTSFRCSRYEPLSKTSESNGVHHRSQCRPERLARLARLAVELGYVDWQTSAVEAVRLERIDAGRHEVSAFRCGDPALDHWLQDEAVAADHQAGTTVRVATNGDHVIACYRLGAFQIEARTVPPRRTVGPPPLPAILVSHLGVDLQYQNRGIGSALLWDALRVAECAAGPLGVRVVVAHAVGEQATRFM